jgi:lipoate---protein ligase
MNCILSSEHNASFNIAAEEFLLKESAEDFFMIYRNEPSVIIGKHQNALAEINQSYLTEKGIQLVRRLSGGGTVYHDMGNINFLFVQSGEAGKLVDFKRFLMPILTILRKMGLPVEYGGRNDLLLNGKKISGNAEHVFRNRILHHGTLLYSSDLNVLENALKVIPGKFIDKAVQSVKSKVTNISEYLENPASVEEFSEIIFEKVKSAFETTRNYSFVENDINQIHSLVEKKYGNWNWNYGYSPDFEYLLKGTYKQIPLQFKIIVKEGHIVNLQFEKTELEKAYIQSLQSQLIGLIFNEEYVTRILRTRNFIVYNS